MMATDVSPWITKWQRAPNVLASIRSKVAVSMCKRTVGHASWMAIRFCARAERTTLRQAVDRDVRQSEEEMRSMLIGHSPIYLCVSDPLSASTQRRSERGA